MLKIFSHTTAEAMNTNCQRGICAIQAHQLETGGNAIAPQSRHQWFNSSSSMN